MSDKDIAYLGCKIVNGYMTSDWPALVFPAGFLGEYFIAYNPEAAESGVAWQYGCFELESDEPSGGMHLAANLDEAVACLEAEYQVKHQMEDLGHLEQYQKMINQQIAHPLKAYFTVNDLSLSGAPSLTLQDDRSNEDYYCFSIWMDDLKIELSWHIQNGSAASINDAENFDTFEEAEKYLQDKYAIRISGEHCSASALKNFKEMHRLLKDIKRA